ncbi:MAG: hypothetical protein OEY89_10715, partial [Gammaproteobacteria bacterium]|nr:hypothetical protein [Gammaproteobacteria bacterium]
MKVTLIQSGTLLLTSLISFNSYALSTGDLLAINAGVQTVDPGYGSLSGISAGSWYAWDLNGDGIIDPSDQMPLLAGTAGGLQLGSTTAAGEMTAPSTFLGVDTYFYFPTTPATILSDDGAGHIELDFTGLVWDFNVASYSLAGNSAFSDTGI